MRRRTRVLLILVNAGLAIAYLRGGEWFGWVFVVSAALIVFGYFRYGAVTAAFRAVRVGQLGTARLALEETPTRFLSPRCEAYSHWVRAALAEADGDLVRALAELVKANQLVLPLNDRAVILTIQSAILLRQGEKSAAKRVLNVAEALGPSGRAATLLAKGRAQLDEAD